MNKKFAILIFVLTALFQVFVFVYSVRAAVFTEEFNADDFRNVWTGDRAVNARDRIGGNGTGRWNIWLQNWWTSNARGGPYPNCDDAQPGQCPLCPAAGQCSEYYGTNPGNARVRVQSGYLEMLNEGDRCGSRNHRFQYVRSFDPYVTSSNFETTARFQINNPKGWGVGWGAEGIFRIWNVNNYSNTIISFDGVGQYTLPGIDANWHTLRVTSKDGRRDAWVDGNYVGGGNSGTIATGYIWFGNDDDNPARYASGWWPECDPINDGMADWPILRIDYIRFNFAPENRPASVLVPPNSTCESAGNRVRFQTIHRDPDGYNDLKYVGFLMNSDLNFDANSGTPGAFYGRYSLKNFTESSYNFSANHFYIRNDNNTAWSDLGIVGSLTTRENSYVKLLNTSTASGGGEELTVYWDLEFKPTWTENVNIYLYARDDSDLYDGWEDGGDFGIDNSPPAVPGNPSPANGSCLDNPNPILSALSSDTGCGSANIQYQFQLDYDSDHSSWNQSRGWGDNSWETSFNLGNGAYYWQVRAKDGVENASNWSDWWNFRIPCNEAPTAINLSKSEGDYCQASFPPIYLSWIFSDIDLGDSQSAYQIQIDNTYGFPSPEIDTGKVSSFSNTYAPVNLSYNTVYYWRVKVWDNHDAESIWAAGSSFATAKHAYPYINFSWIPSSPRVNQPVLFEDQSTVYGGAAKTYWQWNFPEGFATSSSNLRDIVNECLSSGVKTVNLGVTDSDGYFCEDSRSVPCGGAFLPPQWQEIPPILWLKKFFAGFFGIFQYALAF